MTGELFSLSSLLANNSSSFTLMCYELARDAFRVAKVWLYHLLKKRGQSLYLPMQNELHLID